MANKTLLFEFISKVFREKIILLGKTVLKTTSKNSFILSLNCLLRKINDIYAHLEIWRYMYLRNQITENEPIWLNSVPLVKVTIIRLQVLHMLCFKNLGNSRTDAACPACQSYEDKVLTQFIYLLYDFHKP